MAFKLNPSHAVVELNKTTIRLKMKVTEGFFMIEFMLYGIS